MKKMLAIILVSLVLSGCEKNGSQNDLIINNTEEENVVMDENDDNKLLTAFDSQKYSPEQIRAILEEYKHRKSINNFQTKLNDLSGWVVDDKCINLE